MRTRLAASACAALLLLTACGGAAPTSGVRPTTPAASPSADAVPTSAPTTATPPPAPAVAEGIDASHHQGPIDWDRVAAAGIRFAYLKASEGTGFVDPRFAAHRAGAARAGLAVAGYHYFQLCSDGRAQAEHFLTVLGGRADPDLPPAVDLELAGSCTSPPPADELLAEVRAFLATVDERLGTTTLVYLYPAFEDRFRFADDLADHPQWVRRLGRRPPAREWAVWQYDDRGSVPGVRGGVDRNRGTIPVGRR
ncbi:glycoside hydrolase family 25 protein [Nocardioides sp. R1-1]|uniref:glycoside hydrolase family 25 protein n=1 Tax=Nocardioides sp. R1-1 TaxID=3383502 RepID=UPI0038CF9977